MLKILAPRQARPPSAVYPYWRIIEDGVSNFLEHNLCPTQVDLRRRREQTAYVMNAYRQALSYVIPGAFDVKYCVFGSVQSRTCLPDGDNEAQAGAAAE